MIPFLPFAIDATNKRKRDDEAREARNALGEALRSEDPLIDALGEKVGNESAQRLFKAYAACCMYADGFDIAINEPEKISGENESIELLELLEIIEVSQRAVAAASILATETESRESFREVEFILTGRVPPGERARNTTRDEIVQYARVVGNHLESAFVCFGYTLDSSITLYSGYDAGGDADDEESEDDQSFAWEGPFLSTSTDSGVARRFSQSQMGFAVGGGVWKLVIDRGVRVLPLTADVFGTPLIEPLWIENGSIMDEKEVLLSRYETGMAYTSNLMQ